LLFANHESAHFRLSTPNNAHLHVWLWALSPRIAYTASNGLKAAVGGARTPRNPKESRGFCCLRITKALASDQAHRTTHTCMSGSGSSQDWVYRKVGGNNAGRSTLFSWGMSAITDNNCTQSTSFFCWASLHAQRTSAHSQFSCLSGALLHTQTTIAHSQLPFFVGHHCMHRGRVHAVNFLAFVGHHCTHRRRSHAVKFLFLLGIIACTEDECTQSISCFCGASLHTQTTIERSQLPFFVGHHCMHRGRVHAVNLLALVGHRPL